MNRGRRYGRWPKRLGYVYLVYLVFAFLLLGINPITATLNDGEALGPDGNGQPLGDGDGQRPSGSSPQPPQA